MLIPLVKVKRISVKGKETTIVDISFCAEVKGKYLQDIFVKRYKVLVVQCIDQDKAEQLKKLSLKDLAYTVKKTGTTEFSDYKVFSVGIKQINHFKKQRKKSPDKPTTEICFFTNTPFEIDTISLNHLSYIFIPYMDRDEREPFLQTPTIEVIIENGNEMTTGKTYLKQDGKTFTGTLKYINTPDNPLAPHGDGEPLTVADVPNNTVQNNRIFNELKLKPSDFVIGNTSQMKKLPTAYISNLFFSRSDDSEQTNRFCFAVNFRKIVEDYSLYPGIIKNSGMSANYGKIKRIQILRKKVLSGENKIEVIASLSSEDFSGEFTTTKPPNSQEGEPEILIGALKELILSSREQNLKYFTGTDVKINSLGGKYQYGVQLVFEDHTDKVVQGFTNIVQQSLEVFKRYNRLAQDTNPKTNERYYDIGSSTFSTSFPSALRINRISNVEISTALSDFIRVFSLFTTKAVNIDVYIARILPMVSPVLGSAENINRVTELIQEFVAALETIHKKRQRSAMTGPQSPSGAPNTMSGLKDTKIERWMHPFSAYNTEFSRDDGYIFLPIADATAADSVGLSRISTQNYEALVQSQHDKLFKSGAEKISILLPNQPASAPDAGPSAISADLNLTMATYLSPLSLRINGKYFSFLKSNTSFYDIENYNLNFANIISENLGFSVLKRMENKLTELLLGVFGGPGAGLSIEDIFLKPASDEPCSTSLIANTTSTMDEEAVAPQDISSAEQQEINDLSSPETQANSLTALFKLLSLFMSQNNAEWFGKEIGESKFNINNKPSVLDLLTPISLQQLPNHIKALIAIATNKTFASPTLSISLELAGTPEMHQAWYYENFMNLVEVQILRGFSGGQLGAPNWEKISKNDLSTLPQGESRLCRMVKYDKINSGMSNAQELKLSIYNEYFILEGTNETALPPPVASPGPEGLPGQVAHQTFRDEVNPVNIRTSVDYAALPSPPPLRRAPRRRRGRPASPRATSPRPARSSSSRSAPPGTRPAGPIGGPRGPMGPTGGGRTGGRY